MNAGGGGSVGHGVPLRSFLHRAVVGGNRELELGVEDSVVGGGHEGVDGVGTDGAGTLLKLLCLLDRGCGRTK